MRKDDEMIKGLLQNLEKDAHPTVDQKEKMLNNILTSANEQSSSIDKIKSLVTTYPWRFAFAASAVQAAVFTLIFGTQYTNIFVGFFGG